MPLTSAQYVKQNGLVCPACKTVNVYARDFTVGGGPTAYQNCDCCECGASWTDHYGLTGYDELKPGPSSIKR